MKANKSIFHSLKVLTKNRKKSIENSMDYDWNIFIKTIMDSFKFR